MSSIELSIPADLTAAQIRRVNPSINEETAQELAAELHDIIACVRESYAALPCDRPPPVFEENDVSFEEIDVIQTLLRTVADFWPSDKDSAANESIWLMGMLTRAGDHELYLRYMRFCDRVNGADLVTRFGLDF